MQDPTCEDVQRIRYTPIRNVSYIFQVQQAHGGDVAISQSRALSMIANMFSDCQQRNIPSIVLFLAVDSPHDLFLCADGDRVFLELHPARPCRYWQQRDQQRQRARDNEGY